MQITTWLVKCRRGGATSASRSGGGTFGRMKRFDPWAVLLGLGTLAAAAIASTGKAVDKIRPTKRGRLTFAGDSIAHGIATAWKTPPPPLDVSEVGSSAQAWVGSRWLAALAPHPVQIVMSIGSNDYSASAGLGSTIHELHDQAASAGVPVLWVIPPGPAARVVKAAVGNLPSVSSADLPMSPDGVHPTTAGYRLLAARVAGKLH